MVTDNLIVRWVALSCATLAFGSIGTWAKATVLGIGVSAGGLSGGGWVTLTIAIIDAVLVLQPAWIHGWQWGTEHRLGLAVWLAAVALLVCLMNLGGIQDDGLSGIITPGWGLYLATLASVSLIASLVALRSGSRSAADR